MKEEEKEEVSYETPKKEALVFEHQPSVEQQINNAGMLEIQSHLQVFQNPIMKEIVITLYQPH